MRYIYYFVFIVIGVLLGLSIIAIAGNKGSIALLSTTIYVLGLYVLLYVLTVSLLIKYRTIPYCTMMLKIRPTVLFFNKRAVAYLRRGDYELALQDLQAVIQLKPKRANAYINRGFAYVMTRQYEQSLQDFNYALQLAPKGARAYLGRGIVHCATRRYQEALQDFDSVLKLPFRALFAAAYMGKAEAYAYLKDYQQALQECERAVALAPRKAES